MRVLFSAKCCIIDNHSTINRVTVKANLKVSEEKEGVMGSGLRKGLTSYGDAGFSLFLRKAFIKAMGYSEDALDRPIVGITNTYSDYNPCHGNVPTLIEAVSRLYAWPSAACSRTPALDARLPALDLS